MVKHSPRVTRLFSALSNPTRRGILETLRSGERAISELAEPYDMSLVAVSKHVRVLKEAGLLRIRREGRSRLCRLDPEPMIEGMEWMARFRAFWGAELDQIQRFLEAGESAPDPEAAHRGGSHGGK